MSRKSILAAVVCFIAAMMTCFFVGCGDGDKMTISIANKAELTAKWVVGEADRSVEIALKPDTYTLANTNVTASTSDADVIAVDGMKLTAKSGGICVSFLTDAGDDEIFLGDKTNTGQFFVSEFVESGNGVNNFLHLEQSPNFIIAFFRRRRRSIGR